MSYTAIIKLERETEIKVCFNTEPKPKSHVWDDDSKFMINKLTEWQSNSKLISFYSKGESDKVIRYVKEWNDNTHFPINLALKKGHEVDCIEIKPISDIDKQTITKFAFFKNPKEETVSEERRYTRKQLQEAFMIDSDGISFEDFLTKL